MGKLPDHLPAGTMLDKQCVLARYLRAPRHVGHFYEQGRVANVDRGNTAVDDTLGGVDFVGRQAHLVGVVITGRGNSGQHVAQFRFVIDELQQGFATGAAAADAEHVLGSRVQINDKQAVIEQDDAGTQAVEDAGGMFVQRSVAGTAALYRTVLCWT